MSVNWYVNRLAAMSWREVIHRGNEQIKRSASRRRVYGWEAFPPGDLPLPIPGLAEKLKAGMNPPLEAALRASVEDILAGRFSAHGVDWPQRDPDNLFPPDLWRLDPVTGKLWPGPEVFCFDCGYRHAKEIGDVKFVWDLNRLQFLQPLAAAVALWNDPRALGVIEAAISGWARANPPFGGVVWNSGIELSLRAVTIAMVHSLCGSRLSEDVRHWIARILSAHLYWLNRYPSLFSSANNHLVAEALGEFVVGCVVPTAPQAALIAKHACEVIEREAGLQLLPDGVPAEQSPTYGAFTAEMILLVDLVADAFGRPLSRDVMKRLTVYADFVGTLGDARGRVPNIGDDDEGRVLSLCAAREYAYPSSIARAIAGRAGTSPRIAASADAPELRDAFFRTDRPDDIPSDGIRTFEAGGYTVVRETRAGRRARVTIDHGPLGYLSIAAHGHADANSITLSLDDMDVLVDPGTYLYHSGRSWRDWFRGTGSHNTVRLGGVDQSLIAGPFNWSHKARGLLESVVDTETDWAVTAQHDGYLKRFGVNHQRRLATSPTGLVIEDRLIGQPMREPLEAEVVFQFAPGLTVDNERQVWVVKRQGAHVLTIAFTHEGEMTAVAGGEAPGDGGWVSESFGDKIAAIRLVWRGKLPADGLRTVLNWGSLRK